MGANGVIETWADVERCMQETRCDGVMSAEGLLENPSLFYGQHVPQDTLIRRYLELTEKYPEDQIMKMAKKHMYQFLHGELSIATELRPKLGQSRSLDEIRAVATEIAERRAQENLPERGWYRRHWKGSKVNENAEPAVEPSGKKRDTSTTVAAGPGDGVADGGADGAAP